MQVLLPRGYSLLCLGTSLPSLASVSSRIPKHRLFILMELVGIRGCRFDPLSNLACGPN